MRILRIILIVSCFVSPSFAQKGINFFKSTSLTAAVNAAKQQNKLLFVEVYAPDCHICNAFKGTFAQPQVGNVYNSKFINFQLDIRKPEYQQILKQLKININATPTFLFFDPKTMKLVQAKLFGEKDNSIINVNSIAQKAANPADQAGNFATKFKAGEKSIPFLTNYAEYARIVGDTANNIQVVNTLAKQYPQNQYLTQNTLNMIQLVMMNNDNVLFDYFVGHLSQFNRLADPGLVRMIYENVFQIVMTSSQMNKLNSAGITTLKNQMTKAGIDKNSIIRRTWMAEASLLFKQKKGQQAIKVIDGLINVLPSAPGPKEYQYLCDFVKSKTKEKPALSYANKYWCTFGTK